MTQEIRVYRILSIKSKCIYVKVTGRVYNFKVYGQIWTLYQVTNDVTALVSPMKELRKEFQFAQIGVCLLVCP